MVQEIITWCSVHYAQGSKVEGKTYEPILLPGWRSPRFIHLCDPCAKERFDDLTAEIGELGETVDKTPPPVNVLRENRRGKAIQDGPAQKKDRAKDRYSAGVSCPSPGDCDRPDRAYRTRASMRDHMERVHGQELAEYEAKVGTSAEGFEIKHHCDQKGCKHGYASAQGLSNHLRIDHGR